MKGMRKLSITATAMVAAAVMALAGCGSSGTADSAASGSSGSAKSDTFMAAGLFPLTGSMAYLGPANIATMKLAQKDINAAGGVLGKDIEITSADTSDADHADQNTSSAQSVLAKNPSVVVGPPSSSVVKNTYKQVTSAKVPMISSGATSTAFSGLSDYFFRTIPPDTVQGAVLGQIIAQDGVKNLAIAVFNDEYGTSLRDVVVKTVEDAGVNVVYGEKDTFDPTETNFSSMVTACSRAPPAPFQVPTRPRNSRRTSSPSTPRSPISRTPPKRMTRSCWPRSPRRRAAPRTVRPCRRTLWPSPAPPRARNAIPTRLASPC